MFIPSRGQNGGRQQRHLRCLRISRAQRGLRRKKWILELSPQIDPNWDREGGQTPHCPMLGGAEVEPVEYPGDRGLRTGSVGAGGPGRSSAAPEPGPGLASRSRTGLRA